MVTKNVNIHVLVVDDDPINMEILCKSLEREGYKTTKSTDGRDAWQKLEASPEAYDIILLDKMMPHMNGMEVLARMKKHPILRDIPVILQTGDIGDDVTQEGITAGAYYYLTKPFKADVMIAIVNSAIRNFVLQHSAEPTPTHDKTLAGMIHEGLFKIYTPKEAVALAGALSVAAVKPHDANIALLELLMNAIEHGNLGLGYEKKKEFYLAGTLDEEIERRMNLRENIGKMVKVRVVSKEDELEVLISDEGRGFNWESFLEFDPIRLIEPNGRSIAIINNLMDVKLKFVPPGNQVICRFKKKRV